MSILSLVLAEASRSCPLQNHSRADYYTRLFGIDTTTHLTPGMEIFRESDLESPTIGHTHCKMMYHTRSNS